MRRLAAHTYRSSWALAVLIYFVSSQVPAQRSEDVTQCISPIIKFLQREPDASRARLTEINISRIEVGERFIKSFLYSAVLRVGQLGSQEDLSNTNGQESVSTQ